MLFQLHGFSVEVSVIFSKIVVFQFPSELRRFSMFSMYALCKLNVVLHKNGLASIVTGKSVNDTNIQRKSIGNTSKMPYNIAILTTLPFEYM